MAKVTRVSKTRRTSVSVGEIKKPLKKLIKKPLGPPLPPRPIRRPKARGKTLFELKHPHMRG